jgi:hypothetical protein
VKLINLTAHLDVLRSAATVVNHAAHQQLDDFQAKQLTRAAEQITAVANALDQTGETA